MIAHDPVIARDRENTSNADCRVLLTLIFLFKSIFLAFGFFWFALICVDSRPQGFDLRLSAKSAAEFGRELLSFLPISCVGYRIPQ